MINIEFETPTESICECCGNVTVRLTRFVYRNGDAHAVYYAQYTSGHSEKRLSGLIGIGEWGEMGTPEERIAFPFQIWTDEKKLQSWSRGRCRFTLQPCNIPRAHTR